MSLLLLLVEVKQQLDAGTRGTKLDCVVNGCSFLFILDKGLSSVGKQTLEDFTASRSAYG